MRAATLSVGSELLLGDIDDTNATWLAKRLSEIGVEVVAHSVVADDLGRAVDVLRRLMGDADVVVVGGGLGPTPDDLTREVVAVAAGVALERRPELEEQLYSLYRSWRRSMPESNLRQADLPAGSRVLAAVGTAPGFALDVTVDDGRTVTVYAVPGVPSELKTMVERDVLTELVQRTGRAATVTRVLRVTGMAEAAVAEALAPVHEDAERDEIVTVSYLANAEEVHVRLTARGTDAADAWARAEPLVARASALLGSKVAGIDDERLEDAVARLLRRAGLSVATAESCTAGMVAARLASVPGATDYLRGGMVAYATDVKRDVLGVAPDVLDEHGPVSVEVTREMARRAREVFSADVGLGVACVTGPTTQNGRDVGTTVWALATPDGAIEVGERRIPGDRMTVQSRASTACLDALRQWLAEQHV